MMPVVAELARGQAARAAADPEISNAEMTAFKSRLFRIPGKGGWTFAPIPKRSAPPVTAGWGRTPVQATVDGQTWKTSVWWDTKRQQTLLAIPKRIRRDKGDGDTVIVELKFDL